MDSQFMRTSVAMIAMAVEAWAAVAKEGASPPDGRDPPAHAYTDCQGRKSGDRVEHRTREGTVAATCLDSAKGLVARPDRPGDSGKPARADATADRRYSLDQALSDRAQLHTIAFDALAFLTGDFSHDTFLPPGKVSDYFGFQYMRDIDVRENGHNTAFLTRIAHNVLSTLNNDQRRRLISLAEEQEGDIRRFAELRLPLIKAFRMNLEASPSKEAKVLDRDAIIKYSASLYELDGKLAYRRAQVMADILVGLSERQQAALAQLKFGDSATWPNVAEPAERKTLPHERNVAVMTYASEMFSWYAGSLDADTYFCPERHGMYFGGFGMKTAPAMGKPDYSISTSLTGNSGESFLAALTDAQRGQVEALVGLQRPLLKEIVRVRRGIAEELRRFLRGEAADRDRVVSMAKRYGELDGAISYSYATTFAKVGRSLSPQQRRALAGLRPADPSAPKGPFLYSRPVDLPDTGVDTRFFTTGIRPTN
jgi:Spy/CpxP family protein refolding chaperone